MVAQLDEKLLQRHRIGNSKNRRARRHHLAHQLVAKLDGGAHQVDIVLFQNALFFARFQQRLHIHGGFFLGSDRLLSQRRH